MNNLYYFLILATAFNLVSSDNKKTDHTTNESLVKTVSNLSIDHFNIWVKNPQQAKKRLTDIGFTAVPDSLSIIHTGQGTTGRYFYFLNSYLELIFIYDQVEFEQNVARNKQMDFLERANFSKNEASPIGIALKLKEYIPEKIPFEKISYHQDWMEADANIYAAKNSKKNLKEPSIFVVYPQIEADEFETLGDLNKIPEEHALWREFFKHPNGAKKITNMVITSTEISLSSSTIQALKEIENLTIQKGNEYLMELYFDENIQGKSFDLRPELPLKIYL